MAKLKATIEKGSGKCRKSIYKSKFHVYKNIDKYINTSCFSVNPHLKSQYQQTKKHYSKVDQDNAPIVFLELIRPDGKKIPRIFKTLLDLGASASVVLSKVVQDLDTEIAKFMAFQTMTGMFNTTHMCETKFKIPELNQSAEISKKLHVAQMNGRYIVILGQDVLKELKLVINFHAEIV